MTEKVYLENIVYHEVIFGVWLLELYFLRKIFSIKRGKVTSLTCGRRSFSFANGATLTL